MHPTHVAGVLDLEAAVHDHCQTAIDRYPNAFLVDHAELAPEDTSMDRYRFLRDPGQRVRCAEDVDDVDRHGYFRQPRIRPLSEDLRLAGVDRDHVVTVSLEVVADEVARPQLVVREAHDRDGLRGVEHPLDRHWVLIRREIGHGVASFVPTVAATRANPRSRSQIRSSTDSVPTDSRTVPGPTPAASNSSSLSCRCVVLAG